MRQAVKYVAKPMEIEACQWDGTDEDAYAIHEWIRSLGGDVRVMSHPYAGHLHWYVLLPDRNDGLMVSPYDYIVREGEALLPVSRDAFQKLYEEVKDGEG